MFLSVFQLWNRSEKQYYLHKNMNRKYFQKCVNVTEGYTTSQQCTDVTRLQCSIKQQVRG